MWLLGSGHIIGIGMWPFPSRAPSIPSSKGMVVWGSRRQTDRELKTVCIFLRQIIPKRNTIIDTKVMRAELSCDRRP